MGRRRKQVVKVIKRTLPQAFLCPKCGKNTIKAFVDEKNQLGVVVCGACDLRGQFPVTQRMDPVDVYSTFVDKFYAGEKLGAEKGWAA